MSLLQWVLYNSYVEFDGVTYHQIRGTAMGTPVAPAFAILFMSALDRELTSHPAHSHAMIHRRFIDDGAGVWTGDKDSLVSWLNAFNTIFLFNLFDVGNNAIRLPSKLTAFNNNSSFSRYIEGIFQKCAISL